MAKDINKLKERLDSLLKKARDAGSTPAEVEDAMKAAQKLMDKYGLSEDDLKNVQENDFVLRVHERPEARKFHPVIRYCLPYIAKYTGTKAWIQDAGDRSPLVTTEKESIVVYGLAADVELAEWLLSSLKQFMSDQLEQYVKWDMPSGLTKVERTRERVSFIREFCTTINNRLNTLTMEMQRAKGSVETGTALIVLKNQLVTQRLSDKGMKFGDAVNLDGQGTGGKHGGHYGRSAAEQASLGRGVEQGHIALPSS